MSSNMGSGIPDPVSLETPFVSTHMGYFVVKVA